MVSILKIVWLLRTILDHHNVKSLALQLDLLKINVWVDSSGKAGLGQGAHDVGLSPERAGIHTHYRPCVVDTVGNVAVPGMTGRVGQAHDVLNHVACLGMRITFEIPMVALLPGGDQISNDF